MSDQKPTRDVDDATMQKFIALIHRHTGITLRPNRRAMLQGRLQPRMRELALAQYGDYLKYLDGHPTEVPNFINLITTNETYFYRTPRIWDHIENEYVPRWIAQNPGATFTAWSAAASTGEEAHTLGIVLQHLKRKHPAFNYRVAGSDISRRVLEVAARGEYSGRAVELFKSTRPDLYAAYLQPNAAGTLSALPEIKKQISFQWHNLFDRPTNGTRYDLVLMRNVLIYFEPRDQEKVLTNIHAAMKPESLLVIGESESLTPLTTAFTYKMPLVYDSGPARAAIGTAS